MSIHPTAVVDPAAELDEGVSVGPYSVIGADVRIAAGTQVGPHVVVVGPTTIGRDNKVFQFASIGEDPQDKKYAGERTTLEIGDGNTIREYVTINRGTVQDRGKTSVGNGNWIMAYVHIAHDCALGNDIILANSATLAGHVEIRDHAILGGFTKVHQFCRIGSYAFCGMDCGIKNDVPPYVTVSGHPAEPKGVNTEGLRRHGMDADRIAAIKRGYRTLYREGLRLEQALEGLRAQSGGSDVALLVEFLEESRRGIVR